MYYEPLVMLALTVLVHTMGSLSVQLEGDDCKYVI